MKVAAAMPSIQRNIAPIGAQDVANLLAPQLNQLNAQFGFLNSRLDGLQIQLMNSSATRAEDDIVAKLQLVPVAPAGAPQNAPLPVPAVFPGTREDLFALSAAHANILLNYYGIQVPPNASVKRKRNVLANYLGVPIRV